MSSHEYRDAPSDDRSASFVTGTQALVRLLLAQSELDRGNGLHTAGFVSGYRGSPLSGLDQELWRNQAAFDTAGIRFLPAINEDLAATAILGTQRIGSDPDALYEGIFSLWYGKGPGVDRSGDALRHGNAYGTSPKGGVLVVAGDDHGCVSSSMPHQSEQAFIAWSMPVVNPANLSDYLEFGLYGWALSRFSGTWVGFKAIAETIESAASVESTPLPRFHSPADYVHPHHGVHYRWPDFPNVSIEERLASKLDAVAAFASANSIDRQIVMSPRARIGIITCGKAHLDLMEALRLLGLDVSALSKLGIRLYKIGLSYPIEKKRLLEFVEGLQDILVVEEKGPIVEQQIKSFLFNQPTIMRPIVQGKSDELGRPFIPATGELRPSLLLPLLVRWMGRHFPAHQFTERSAYCDLPLPIIKDADLAKRTPYYCSGCPHNRSTVVPDGSRALAGIGCHFMAAWMDRKTSGLTQMGGEGADWVGQSLFTKTHHVFQNLGDGTYFHSGYLALRQAVAAGTNITYKILYNDAVAMTGGQPIDGRLTVPQIAQQVIGEGAKEVVVVAEDVARYSVTNDLPAGVAVYGRDELDAVQRHLREIGGVTVLIYDQICAAEKRRRRKRGELPEEPRSVVINAEVCEGCGDCGKQSNCVSILPLETEFGRKRVIDQSSCNKDFSCTDGLCPSFVSVIGGKRKKPQTPMLQAETLRSHLKRYPEPTAATCERPFSILIAGIGGTGVVTVGALIAQAAHLEGKGASTLNFKGFAQKGGAVLDHIRLAETPAALTQARIDKHQADTLLMCDLVVGTSSDALGAIRKGQTIVIASRSEIPTGEFTRNPDLGINTSSLIEGVRQIAGNERTRSFDAQRYARAAFGDTIFANMIIAGYAWQMGAIPISMNAVDTTFEQLGVDAELNRKAFLLGRLIAADENIANQVIGQKTQVIHFIRKTGFEKIVWTRVEVLRRYQNAAYAELYLRQVRMIETCEREIIPAGAPLKLTETVASNLFKLMAYKDEYEVARLLSDASFEAQLNQQFEGKFSVQYHLAPPIFSSANRKRPRKMVFGSWMGVTLRLLQHFRFLRGTVFDPFGYSSERRSERQLIREYSDLLKIFAVRMNVDNRNQAIALAALPERIRGFGPIKSAAIDDAQLKRAVLLEEFEQAGAHSGNDNVEDGEYTDVPTLATYVESK